MDWSIYKPQILPLQPLTNLGQLDPREYILKTESQCFSWRQTAVYLNQSLQICFPLTTSWFQSPNPEKTQGRYSEQRGKRQDDSCLHHFSSLTVIMIAAQVSWSWTARQTTPQAFVRWGGKEVPQNPQLFSSAGHSGKPESCGIRKLQQHFQLCWKKSRPGSRPWLLYNCLSFHTTISFQRKKKCAYLQGNKCR